MNIAEILKNFPKGTTLYSPVYGKVRYLCINTNTKYPIIGETNSDNCTITFTSDGRLNANYDGECMLFPSKEIRDWSTFKVPKKEYEFKPFDKVLVRDIDGQVWRIDFFARNVIGDYKYRTLTADWKQCIPFEGNQHLLGTSNPA